MLSLAGYKRPSRLLPAPTPKRTLYWMVQMTKKGQLDQQMMSLAQKIVQGIFPHDYLSEYTALLNWVRTNIRYVRDPRTIEQVKSARAVVETGTGDCDCLCTLLGTLIGHIGGQVRYVAGAFRRTGNGEPVLTHVWAEAFDPNSKAWVILDPVPGRRVGKMINRLVHAVSIPAIT